MLVKGLHMKKLSAGSLVVVAMALAFGSAQATGAEIVRLTCTAFYPASQPASHLEIDLQRRLVTRVSQGSVFRTVPCEDYRSGDRVE
jgi:hypothetical protein